MEENSNITIKQENEKKLPKKLLPSLNFLQESPNNENIHNTIDILNNIQNIELKIEILLIGYPQSKNQAKKLAKIKNIIDSIPTIVNAMTSSRGESIKLKIATKIRNCLYSIHRDKQFEQEDFKLLLLYLELTVEYGWYQELEKADKIIKLMIESNAYPSYKNTLSLFTKLLKIAALMIDFKIQGAEYELKYLLQNFKDHKIFEEKLCITAFKLIIYAKTKWQIYFASTGIPSPAGENPVSYAYEFCQKIGRLYLHNLHDSDRKLWDIFNYPGIFFDLVHFERENFPEVQRILEMYKQSDFKTKQAICDELKNKKSLTPLLNQILSFSKITEIYSDTTLFYSEIYFTEGKNTQWANSFNGIGYLIVQYDQGWVSLYNTKVGSLTNDIGILFDAKLLDSTKQNLYFKVLKRDGWHLYKSSGGLDLQNWDSIELLCSVNSHRKNPGYLVCKKDKTLHLLELLTGKVVKVFSEARELRFIAHRATIIFAAKIKHLWQLFDLTNDQFIAEFPPNIYAIDRINNSEDYFILTDVEKKYYLYDLNNKTLLILDSFKKIGFVSGSSVFGENEDGSFFSINGLKKYPITKNQYNWLAAYELADRERPSGMYMPGNNTIRYDFKMELQGTYHITYYENNCTLWLSNTVKMFSSHSNGEMLWKSASNIRFLGISQEIFTDKKVFFLIENNNQAFLYVSYYTRLKALSDERRDLTEEEIPHDLIELSSNKIKFLHSNYLLMHQKDQWQLYEHPFGYHHSFIQVNEAEPLDYKNFIKVKIHNCWYLYDLSYRKVVSLQGAKSIEISAESKMVFIYDNYIRYLKYDYLPKCASQDVIANSLKEIKLDKSLFDNNYMANLSKLQEYPGLNAINYNQPFAKLLLTYINHQLLTMLNPDFINKLAELVDGKLFDLSHISEALTDLTSAINSYNTELEAASSQLTQSVRQVKQKIRNLTKKITSIESSADLSLSLRNELITKLKVISDKLHTLNLSVQETLKLRQTKLKNTDDITRDLIKLEEKLKQIVVEKWEQKNKEKQNILEMFNTHRHLLAGLLRYWLQVDPRGEKIATLYQRLAALGDLYQRIKQLNEAPLESIVKKYYLILMKLYAFDLRLINNYIMAESDINNNLNAVQILLPLLDFLKITENELKIFNKILELGPTLAPKYEDLSTRATRQTEYAHLKECIEALRHMAIANELDNKNVYSLNLNTYKKNSGQKLIIKDMAAEIRQPFYHKLGILVDNNIQDNIDIQYMPNILHASENLQGNDQTILKILLKAAVYQLDIKDLFILTLPIKSESLFSASEKLFIKKLQKHNLSVQSKFNKSNINWNLWQNGIEKIEGKNIRISLWRRNISHDLFQGEFCNSCISLSKPNARANLHYLVDFNFSMIEIIERNHQKTIGHVTIWIGLLEDKNFVLVLNTIQLHRRYEDESYRQLQCEIRELIFTYATRLAAKLDITKVILGREFNKVPLEILDVLDDICNNESYDDNSIEDDNPQPTIIENELSIKIIYPTFTEVFYSDIYSYIYEEGGWVTTQDMIKEKASVWNISLFVEKTEFLPRSNIPVQKLAIPEEFEIWLIKDNRLEDFRIENNGSESLILINYNFWRDNWQQCLNNIYQELNITATVPDTEFKNTPNVPAFNETNYLTSPNVINFNNSEQAKDNDILEQVKRKSLETAKLEDGIGPRKIPHWILEDVEAKGNCFYLAVIDQLLLINHNFIKEVPSSTAAHDCLRLRIQGAEFKDLEYADHKEIIETCKKLNLIVAIVDTRYPGLGFVYHYINQHGMPDSKKSLRNLPNKPIIRIAYTGNHYLSVRAHVDLETITLSYIVVAKRARLYLAGQLRKNLREIDEELKLLKSQDCTTKEMKIRLMQIIQSARIMGKQHPILIAAQKCLGLLARINTGSLITTVSTRTKSPLYSADKQESNSLLVLLSSFNQAMRVKPVLEQTDIPLVAITFRDMLAANLFSEQLFHIGITNKDGYPLKINEDKEKLCTIYISDAIYNMIMDNDDAYAELVSMTQASVLENISCSA